MIKVAILTVSDSCGNGTREDVSGRTIANMLPKDTFQICQKKIVRDDRAAITRELIDFADRDKVDVVYTTGGTGLGPRDVTPEATASVGDKVVPGLGEIMRTEGFKKTPNAVLSRATACVRGRTLIVNLPGSPKAVRESLEIIRDIIPHSVAMIKGGGH
jgi:molybdopterin adenylyltransferase